MENFLKETINWFWLRPENAVLTALRANKYAETFKYFHANSLDVSCGDGLFSFITAGGELEPESDMYQSLDSPKVRKGNFDIYDYYDGNYQINIKKSPKHTYKYGIDWKDNLLKKAKVLNFYDELIVHDNNKLLPFPDDSINYVYTNSAYWVKNFDEHIADLIRVTKPGGHIVLEMKNLKNMQKFSSSHYAKKIMGEKFCEIIDAGRFETWKGLKTLSHFDEVIKKHTNIEVVQREPLYGDIVAYMWDIGLRPLFNPMIKLINNVDKDIRMEVKKEWCETIYNLTAEFVKNYKPIEKDAIEYIYTLKKL